ncbi:MAG: TonB-dependent receptor [Bacteroidota bacterium]|nr:TonB-dependent receptor [Bacteroidota bacterium]
MGFTAPGLYAQTGKISAKILDAKSGEPLFKASIQILETKQGALSKDNGIATIINVAPSEHYTVVAKYAGYEPFTIKGVKVQSDQTTKLEFKLSSKIQDTIVVAAEKLVDVTKVGIGDKLSNSDIIAIAGTKNISEVVAVTPGIVKDASNGGFSVHGSRGTDNSERINNIETTNIVNGGESISQKTTSKFAISELSIATGGLDASKGNTTGAEINATTRAGGSRFEFQLRYRTDVPAMFGSSSNGYKQMGSNDKTYELALGGPLTEDIKYFITAKGITQQFEDELANGTSFGVNGDVGLNVIDPAGNNLGQLPNAHYYSRGATANISFDLLGFHMAADAVLSSVNRQFTGWGSTYGDPAEIPAANSIDNLYTLTGNTSIGSSGILKLTAGYQAASDHIGKYDFAAGGGLFSMYKIYNAADNFSYDDNTHTITPGGDGIVDIYTPVSKQIADPHNPSNLLNLPGAGINPFTGRIEGGGIVYSTNNPYGLLNTFLTAGNVFGFTNQTRQQVQIEGQYNDQFGSHGILGGFETHFYNISNYDNLLPWDANPFRDSFTVKPLIAAVYLVDKMEFSDITFQPSLRFDIYNPGNNHVLVDPYNPIRYDTTVDANGKKTVTSVGNFSTAPVQTQLSPRLGITYSVSDKTLFNFSYGLYFKPPLFLSVLTNTGGNFSTALQRGNQIIGNGALKGESDEEIDVGFSTGLTETLKATINGVYKKMRNIAGLARITSSTLALGYSLYTDDQYGSYKGLEFTLEKRMLDNFSVKFNYTYSTSQGTSSSATENYIALINQSSTAENSVLPLQPFPLSFDRTHVAQLLFNLMFGKGEGPKIGGVAFLEHFILNTTTVFESGVPYTAYDVKGTQVGEYNGQREPSFLQTDATLTRNIPFSEIFGSGVGTSSLDIQLEVLNMFNRTEPIFVYSTTGQGDDDGVNPVYGGSTDFINDPTNADGQQLDALGMLKYNARWDLNKDGRVSVDEQTKAFNQQRSDRFARRTNYQIPRRFYLNFTLHF